MSNSAFFTSNVAIFSSNASVFGSNLAVWGSNNITWNYLKNKPFQIWKSDLLGVGVSGQGYYKIATLASTGNSSNGANVEVKGWAGSWGASPMSFRCLIKSRGGLTVSAETQGTFEPNFNIAIYQETLGDFSIYIHNNIANSSWHVEVSTDSTWGGALIFPPSASYVSSPSGTLATTMKNNLVIASSSTNVGIGRSNPSYKLDVNGNIRLGATTGDVLHINTGDGDKIYLLSHGANGTKINCSTNWTLNLQAGQPTTATGNISLQTGSLLGYQSRLYIQNDGKVGINTTAPSSTLDVLGTTTCSNLDITHTFLRVNGSNFIESDKKVDFKKWIKNGPVYNEDNTIDVAGVVLGSLGLIGAGTAGVLLSDTGQIGDAVKADITDLLGGDELDGDYLPDENNLYVHNNNITFPPIFTSSGKTEVGIQSNLYVSRRAKLMGIYHDDLIPIDGGKTKRIATNAITKVVYDFSNDTLYCDSVQTSNVLASNVSTSNLNSSNIFSSNLDTRVFYAKVAQTSNLVSTLFLASNATSCNLYSSNIECIRATASNITSCNIFGSNVNAERMSTNFVLFTTAQGDNST